ncbi:MAG TPA: TIGR03790 family protein, partial [Candidatus Acidoferrales bacterium]|nr:TIGR03790 family protein [Candidatus Acidoferrales bacterium]
MKYSCLLSLLAGFTVHAGGNEVVVLYNSQVPESKTVAEHYAAARNVPAKQIFSFALTTNEVIMRPDFTDFLQKPLAADLERAGLWKFGDVKVAANGATLAHTENRVVSSKIRYAVLCYGMPLKIAPSTYLDELAGTAKGPEIRRDEAAVDSELAWLPLLRMPVPLGGWLPNLLYGCTNHEMLSPTNGILLVTRLDGPTPEIANQLVDKALAAETNGLLGRAYFDTRNEPTNSNYYLGDAWMLAGAELCRELGYDVEVDTNAETFPATYPMSQIAIYAGWYDSDASGPFTLPTVEFMPGAFAYHLHSFSAETLRTMNAHWCGPLLAKGATCTMGCVYEPYLRLTPNVPLFIRS